MNYIYENVEKIRDPKNVLCIKPIKDGCKKLMVAYIKTGEGEYERVSLCKPKHWTVMPLEPIYVMYQYFGKFYFDNFIIIDNLYAINKDELTGFYTTDLENDKSRKSVCATFKDGSSCAVFFPKKKYLEKKGIEMLRKLLKENGKEPKYGATITSTRNLIDLHFVENKAVIEELKKTKISKRSNVGSVID